jgi:hypothetical protein
MYCIENKNTYKNFIISETINWLYDAINKICYRSNININYKIIETNDMSYVDDNIIYLVVWNKKHDRIYNENTLLYSCLTKIPQLLQDDKANLMETAIKLGYYDPNIPTEQDYIITNI